MLLDKLNWRYATKKMDPAKAVPAEKVERILEAIRLAPTSSGLQPFEVIVVSNKDLREKLKVAAFGQSQLGDGSHVLVFAAWDNYTDARIDGVMEDVGAARGGVTDEHRSYYGKMKANFQQRPEQTNFENAARQTYIALGFGLAAAAMESVDASPMEGFEPAKIDEILGLKARGLRSVTLLTLGYRHPDGDWLVGLPKVRRAAAKMFTRLD